jgi:beta-N-acetylhexosaminidase
MARAFITGLEGFSLGATERAFLRDADPWGVILFRRNVSTPDQVLCLTAECRDALGRSDLPVLIDQEGGRVQRLGPPHWPVYPAGSAYAALYAQDRDKGLAAARLGARLIASDLIALGITVDCLPIADVPCEGADAIIGDRAYGAIAEDVAAVGQAIADGLHEGGVLPVLKHLPGHGRANADSHERLPVVDARRGTLESTDFAAFRPLAALPLGMTAHVVYSDIDPDRPATTSLRVISEIVRQLIGFDGALMSDDLSMGALSGSMQERTIASFAAGCDLVLHCNGDMAEMMDVAAYAPMLSGDALRRTNSALARRGAPTELDVAGARQRFSAMMEPVWRIAS